MAMAMAMAVTAMVFLLVAPNLGQAEERPTAAHPHGLPFESPLALSPDAYEFFHPSERARRGHVTMSAAPEISPGGQLRESAASVARADQEEGGVAPVRKVRRGYARAGTVACVVVSAAAVAVVAALAVAYAVARRRVAHGDAEAAAGAGAGARAAPKPNA